MLTSGWELTGLPDGYIAIGQAELFDIPIYIYAVFILLLGFDLLLRFWKPLHNAYYVGHNAKAAELSGIHSKLITMSGYAICSTLAGIAAIIVSSKVRMGYAGFGIGAELIGIAAAVIGGASFFGGHGTILGACLGVIFLSIINNGFVLAGFNPNWQHVISGVTLVLFLAILAHALMLFNIPNLIVCGYFGEAGSVLIPPLEQQIRQGVYPLTDFVVTYHQLKQVGFTRGAALPVLKDFIG